MKFDLHRFWKHVACKDVFFAVNSISFDDDGKSAILYGSWCTQAVKCWFFNGAARIIIRPDQYGNWNKYEPRGKFKP